MNIQAAVFDMDGLLLDTEKLCMQIFRQACETLNLPFHQDVYLSIIGQNSVAIEKVFRRAYGDDLDALHEEWRVNYNAIVKHQAIPVKDGVIELLTWLKERGIPIAVATSTHKDVANKKLRLAGLDGYFDTLACGCEVKHSKPDPEIFLLAATRLGIESQYCVAFEDSNNGVRSAVAAKMTTFQVPDLVSPCEEVKAFGHHIVPSLHTALDYLKSKI